MPKWTAAQLPSLEGKVAIVTGATSGIGLETAAELAAAGAEVVLGCRHEGRAEKAIAQIRQRAPKARTRNIVLDASSLASVQSFAQAFSADYTQLNMLVHNAGVMGVPFSKTVDGHEIVFGTNQLGPFALTGHLLPVLRNTAGARVVTIGSITHQRGKLVLDDLLWERRPYSKSDAYAQSKLANMLYAFDLDRRFKEAGIDAMGVSAHPGYAATNIVYGGSERKTGALMTALVGLGNVLMAQSAAMGALPTLYATAAPDIKGAEFIGPDGFMQFKGHPAQVPCKPKARDMEMAARLWKTCEQLTGVSYLS